MTKNLKVTFEVTALVSPDEFAKWMGYPDGSPENEIEFDKWDQDEFQECITTYGDWNRFFKITGRTVRKVQESDLPFDDNEREAMIEQNIERGVSGPEAWE